jgi:hypothetical protein
MEVVQVISESSTEKYRDWLDKLKIGMELIGLITLIAYTIFAALQWCAIRRTNELTGTSIKNTQNNFADATRLAQLNFRKERRPYVAITNIDNQKLTAERTLDATGTNYGKTPARGVYAYGKFRPSVGDWRDPNCGSQGETQDWKTAGRAIFQDAKFQPIKVIIDPLTPTQDRYLAICVTYMDIEGPFPWKFQNGKQSASWVTQHLFEVTAVSGKLEFKPFYTSIETAEPK